MKFTYIAFSVVVLLLAFGGYSILNESLQPGDDSQHRASVIMSIQPGTDIEALYQDAYGLLADGIKGDDPAKVRRAEELLRAIAHHTEQDDPEHVRGKALLGLADGLTFSARSGEDAALHRQAVDLLRQAIPLQAKDDATVKQYYDARRKLADSLFNIAEAKSDTALYRQALEEYTAVIAGGLSVELKPETLFLAHAGKGRLLVGFANMLKDSIETKKTYYTEAMDCYMTALQFMPREKHPAIWATMQFCMGIAHYYLSESEEPLIKGKYVGIRNLELAVKDWEAALSVSAEEDPNVLESHMLSMLQDAQYFMGMAYYAMARRTASVKYAEAAVVNLKKYLDIMKESGSPNKKRYLDLLLAQNLLADLKKK